MVRKLNIGKYVKFFLASNIIFNNSIFAGCNKKGNKWNNDKWYSGKGDKSTGNNITPDEETKKEEQHKEETPDNPEKDKDYKKEIAGLLWRLSNIEKNISYLPEKSIDFDKNDLQSEIS